MSAHPLEDGQPLGADIAAMAFLQASSLFGGLQDEQLSALYEHGRILEVAAGATLYATGGADDSLYVVMTGRVTLRSHGVELATIERQGVLGETAVLTRQPRADTAVARTVVRLIRLPGELVRTLADAAPKLGRRLAALMAARSREVVRR